MDLQLSDLVTIGGAVVGAIGVWWKINQDTEKKIEGVRLESDKKLEGTRQEHSDAMGKVRTDIATIRATAISRQEHDQDLDKVKQEIREFRDEVRDDIKSLNANLTARFDLMMQKMFELKTYKEN